MKVFLLLLGLAAASRMQAAVNPVSKVVKMFRNMKDTLESEIKAEDAAVAAYKCWCDTTEKEKTASNEAATARIAAIDTELGALAGEGEAGMDAEADLTGERGKLKGEVKEAENALKQHKEDRKAARKTYEKLQAEYETTIVAASDAHNELAEGMQDDARTSVSGDEKKLLEDKTDTSFLAVHKRAQHRADKAVANLILNGMDDDLPLMHELRVAFHQSAQQPLKNSEAVKDYKARSGKILGLIKDILDSTKDKMKNLNDQEGTDQSTYTKTLTALKTQLENAEDALSTMAGETAARNERRKELNDEKDELNEQVSNDEGFIKTTKSDCKKMFKVNAERRVIRMGEVSAVEEAIAMLNDPENREKFSAGFSFMQVDRTPKCTPGALLQKLSRNLRATSKSSRVNSVAIALLLASRSNTAAQPAKSVFDTVVTEMDTMIKQIQTEQSADHKAVNECEAKRKELSNTIYKSALQYDKEDDDRNMNIEKMAEATAQMEATNQTIKENRKELSELQKQRDEDKAEFEKEKAEDEAAQNILKATFEIMKKYYDEQGMTTGATLGLVQLPGQAPPPPPKTPAESGAYEGGAAGGSIMSAISVLYQSLSTDIERAVSAEAQEQSNFDELKTKLDSEKGDLDSMYDTLSSSKSGASDNKKTAFDNMVSQNNTMKSNRDSWDDIDADCTYFAVNYDTRTSERDAEKTAIREAKTILQSAANAIDFLQTGAFAPKMCL